jgi:GxxExxY protein
VTASPSTVDSDPRTAELIGAAIEVHRQLGPGLLESAYEGCLAWELASRGIAFEQQVGLPLIYKGFRLDLGYRIDLIVDAAIIVEVKAVDRVHPLVEAQVLTYLKLTGLRTALICNFNVPLLVHGIKRLSL